MPNISDNYSIVTPFIVTKDAPKLITFMEEVFDAKENKEAHGLDDDGLLIHAEVVVGGSTIMIADRKPDWPFTPSLIRIYVDDVEGTLKHAVDCGAQVITKPTEFYGDLLSRFKDPWGNLWWTSKASEAGWEKADWSEESAKQQRYVLDTLVDAMRDLKG